MTRHVIILLLVLVLLVSASLDCAPLRSDATLSNSLGAASLLVVASPLPLPSALPYQSEYPAMRYPSTEGLSF